MNYKKGVALTLLAKGFALPLGLVSAVITARYLGPEGRGVLALLVVLQGIAIQFGTLGFNASITYFLSRDRSLTTAISSNALLVATFFGIVTALLLWVIDEFAHEFLLGSIEPLYLHVFLLSLPFAFYFQFFQNVFLAHQRIGAFNIIDLFSRFLVLLGFIISLLVLNGSTLEAVAAFTIASIFTGLTSVGYAHKISPLRLRFDSTLFRVMFQYGIRTYVASFLMFLVIRINIPMINSFLGEHEAGIFSAAMQITDLLYILPVTLGTILFPKVASDAKDEGVLTAKVFRFSLVFMTVLSSLLFLAAEPLILLLYGEEFRTAIPLLQWLLPGIVVLSLVTILNNDLAGRGLPWIVVLTPAVGLVVITVVNLIFLNSLGSLAAVAATNGSYTIMLLMLIFYYKHAVPVPLKALFIPRRSDFSLEGGLSIFSGVRK